MPQAPSSKMPDTKVMKNIRNEIYPMIGNGLAGNGFGPESLTALRRSDMAYGLEQSYGTARAELGSQMSRTIGRNDSRLSNYTDNALSRQFITAKDNQRRGFRQEMYDDKQMSFGMAADVLGAEKRMTASNAGAYNNAMAANMQYQQQYGTFGTNLAGGVGSGLMDSYFAGKMAK